MAANVGRLMEAGLGVGATAAAYAMVRVRAASVKAAAIWMHCDMMSSCRLSRRSAMTPPISVKSRMGTSPRKESRPR